MDLGPNWYQIGNRAYHIRKVSKFYVQRISMLTSLKVSSLACKFLFYKTKQNAKGGLRSLKNR